MSGIYVEATQEGSVDQERAYARLEALKHRGPQSFAVTLADTKARSVVVGLDQRPNWDTSEPPNLFVGQRRLVIAQDGEPGHPPMTSRDGNLVIAWDGAIHNGAEICAALGLTDHPLVADGSDGDLLLQAFEEWGADCIRRLRGLFAIVIYDRRTNRLLIARDQTGQKPLYYHLDGKGVRISSELTPLLHGLDHKLVLDELGISRFLMFGYVPHDGTLFASIKKLLPGHYAWIDLESCRIDRNEYWDLGRSGDENLSADEHRERLIHAIREAVHCRLIPGQSTAMFCSGGIDSSLVAKFASEAATSPTLFHADFPDGDQREWIDQVADRYDLPLSVSIIGPEAHLAGGAAFDLFDEPLDSGWASAANALFSEAKRIGSRVMLTGDGGDELFAGYAGHRLYWARIQRIERFRRLPLGGLGGDIAGNLLKLGFRALGGSGINKGGKAFVLANLLCGNFSGGYLSGRGLHGLPGMMKSPPTLDRALEFAHEQLANQPYQDARLLQYVDMKGVLPGKQIYGVDRLGMSFGIETRSAFADHRLAEVAFSIPTSYSIRDGRGKVMAKDILEADLGERFVNRTKQGFHNPRAAFFRAEGAKDVIKPISDRERPLHRYLDYDAFRARFPNLGAPSPAEVMPLWRILSLAMYIEHHVDAIEIP